MRALKEATQDDYSLGSAPQISPAIQTFATSISVLNVGPRIFPRRHQALTALPWQSKAP